MDKDELLSAWVEEVVHVHSSHSSEPSGSTSVRGYVSARTLNIYIQKIDFKRGGNIEA